MSNIKVLKNNLSLETKEEKHIVPYPRKLICEGCESELEYEESDLRMGEYGCMYVDCPVCGQDNMLESNEHSITLTVDNIEFPVHYSHINVENGAKDIFNNDEIKQYLRQAIEYFRNNKDDYSWGGWITGNLFMYVHRYSDDEMYEITISNDFYTMQIPFEEKDYK